MTAWPLIFILFCGTCFSDPSNIGDTCTENSDCTDITNAECSGGTCKCKDGYKGTESCAAIEDGKVNAECDDDTPCTAANSDCVKGFCACNSGYTGDKGDNKCDKNSGVTATSFSSLLYFVVGLTSVAVVVAQ